MGLSRPRVRQPVYEGQAGDLQLSCVSSLIHKLTYRRTNHDNFHVRGYKEKGNINTPLELAILNQVDRFNLAIDVIDRVPRLQATAAHTKEWLKGQIIESVNYAHENGIDQQGDPGVEVAGLRVSPTAPEASIGCAWRGGLKTASTTRLQRTPMKGKASFAAAPMRSKSQLRIMPWPRWRRIFTFSSVRSRASAVSAVLSSSMSRSMMTVRYCSGDRGRPVPETL